MCVKKILFVSAFIAVTANIFCQKPVDYLDSIKDSKIVFDSERYSVRQIHSMNQNNGNMIKLTDGIHENIYHSVNFSKSRIMYQSERDGNFKIRIMEEDGTNQHKITNSMGWNEWPGREINIS
jgi:Tol biopolymer transport system component